MCPRSGTAAGRRHLQRWRIYRERRCPRLGTLAGIRVRESDSGRAVSAGAEAVRVCIHRKGHDSAGRGHIARR